jgi:hypothetical protein
MKTESQKLANLKWISKNPTYHSTYRASPLGRYKMHKKNAEKKGILWEFTFETWWKMWEESGKWEQRGRTGQGRYQMCRYGDVGPYSPENVRIDTQQENMKEQNGLRRKT